MSDNTAVWVLSIWCFLAISLFCWDYSKNVKSTGWKIFTFIVSLVLLTLICIMLSLLTIGLLETRIENTRKNKEKPKAGKIIVTIESNKGEIIKTDTTYFDKQQ